MNPTKHGDEGALDDGKVLQLLGKLVDQGGLEDPFLTSPLMSTNRLMTLLDRIESMDPARKTEAINIMPKFFQMVLTKIDRPSGNLSEEGNDSDSTRRAFKFLVQLLFDERFQRFGFDIRAAMRRLCLALEHTKNRDVIVSQMHCIAEANSLWDNKDLLRSMEDDDRPSFIFRAVLKGFRRYFIGFLDQQNASEKSSTKWDSAELRFDEPAVSVLACLRTLRRCIENLPSPTLDAASEWAPIVLSMLLHSAPNIRAEAYSILTKLSPAKARCAELNQGAFQVFKKSLERLCLMLSKDTTKPDAVRAMTWLIILMGNEIRSHIELREYQHLDFFSKNSEKRKKKLLLKQQQLKKKKGGSRRRIDACNFFVKVIGKGIGAGNKKLGSLLLSSWLALCFNFRGNIDYFVREKYIKVFSRPLTHVISSEYRPRIYSDAFKVWTQIAVWCEEYLWSSQKLFAILILEMMKTVFARLTSRKNPKRRDKMKAKQFSGEREGVSLKSSVFRSIRSVFFTHLTRILSVAASTMKGEKIKAASIIGCGNREKESSSYTHFDKKSDNANDGNRQEFTDVDQILQWCHGDSLDENGKGRKMRLMTDKNETREQEDEIRDGEQVIGESEDDSARKEKGNPVLPSPLSSSNRASAASYMFTHSVEIFEWVLKFLKEDNNDEDDGDGRRKCYVLLRDDPEFQGFCIQLMKTTREAVVTNPRLLSHRHKSLKGKCTAETTNKSSGGEADSRDTYLTAVERIDELYSAKYSSTNSSENAQKGDRSNRNGDKNDDVVTNCVGHGGVEKEGEQLTTTTATTTQSKCTIQTRQKQSTAVLWKVLTLIGPHIKDIAVRIMKMANANNNSNNRKRKQRPERRNRASIVTRKQDGEDHCDKEGDCKGEEDKGVREKYFYERQEPSSSSSSSSRVVAALALGSSLIQAWTEMITDSLLLPINVLNDYRRDSGGGGGGGGGGDNFYHHSRCDSRSSSPNKKYHCYHYYHYLKYEEDLKKAWINLWDIYSNHVVMASRRLSNLKNNASVAQDDDSSKLLGHALYQQVLPTSIRQSHRLMEAINELNRVQIKNCYENRKQMERGRKRGDRTAWNSETKGRCREQDDTKEEEEESSIRRKSFMTTTVFAWTLFMTLKTLEVEKATRCLVHIWFSHDLCQLEEEEAEEMDEGEGVRNEDIVSLICNLIASLKTIINSMQHPSKGWRWFLTLAPACCFYFFHHHHHHHKHGAGKLDTDEGAGKITQIRSGESPPHPRLLLNEEVRKRIVALWKVLVLDVVSLKVAAHTTSSCFNVETLAQPCIDMDVDLGRSSRSKSSVDDMVNENDKSNNNDNETKENHEGEEGHDYHGRCYYGKGHEKKQKQQFTFAQHCRQRYVLHVADVIGFGLLSKPLSPSTYRMWNATFANSKALSNNSKLTPPLWSSRLWEKFNASITMRHCVESGSSRGRWLKTVQQQSKAASATTGQLDCEGGRGGGGGPSTTGTTGAMYTTTATTNRRKKEDPTSAMMTTTTTKEAQLSKIVGAVDLNNSSYFSQGAVMLLRERIGPQTLIDLIVSSSSQSSPSSSSMSSSLRKKPTDDRAEAQASLTMPSPLSSSSSNKRRKRRSNSEQYQHHDQHHKNVNDKREVMQKGIEGDDAKGRGRRREDRRNEEHRLLPPGSCVITRRKAGLSPLPLSSAAASSSSSSSSLSPSLAAGVYASVESSSITTSGSSSMFSPATSISSLSSTGMTMRNKNKRINNKKQKRLKQTTTPTTPNNATSSSSTPASAAALTCASSAAAAADSEIATMTPVTPKLIRHHQTQQEGEGEGEEEEEDEQLGNNDNNVKENTDNTNKNVKSAIHQTGSQNGAEGTPSVMRSSFLTMEQGGNHQEKTMRQSGKDEKMEEEGEDINDSFDDEKVGFHLGRPEERRRESLIMKLVRNKRKQKEEESKSLGESRKEGGGGKEVHPLDTVAGAGGSSAVVDSSSNNAISKKKGMIGGGGTTSSEISPFNADPSFFQNSRTAGGVRVKFVKVDEKQSGNMARKTRKRRRTFTYTSLDKNSLPSVSSLSSDTSPQLHLQQQQLQHQQQIVNLAASQAVNDDNDINDSLEQTLPPPTYVEEDDDNDDCNGNRNLSSPPLPNPNPHLPPPTPAQAAHATNATTQSLDVRVTTREQEDRHEDDEEEQQQEEEVKRANDYHTPNGRMDDNQSNTQPRIDDHRYNDVKLLKQENVRLWHSITLIKVELREMKNSLLRRLEGDSNISSSSRGGSSSKACQDNDRGSLLQKLKALADENLSLKEENSELKKENKEQRSQILSLVNLLHQPSTLTKTKQV
eukprot:jgi/Bigna1/71788/fgenesh1_pg.17_\